MTVVTRVSKETQITLTLRAGTGVAQVRTGDGFLDQHLRDGRRVETVGDVRAVLLRGRCEAAAGATEEEGKSTADVELTDAGASKIAVIKVVKEALALGLKEAKDLVDGAPSMLKTGMKKEDAAELAKKLTDAGAKVTLK